MDNAGNIARRNRMRAPIVRARVEELTRVMLDGALVTLDIEGYVREREQEKDSPWFVPEGRKPLSYASIRRYVVRAEENIARIAEDDHDKLFGRHIAQRRALFQKAVSQGDVRCALAVLQDEAQLYGLYPSRRTEITGKDGAPVSLQMLVLAVNQAEAQAMQAAQAPTPAIESAAHLATLNGDSHAEKETADRQRSEPADA